jgi:hypothetical protein
MTLHALDKQTGESTKWVAVPLELVDWMNAHFRGPFISYLASLNPYEDVPVGDESLVGAPAEIDQVRFTVQRNGQEILPRVDIYQHYGRKGVIRTLSELLDFLAFLKTGDYEVMSLGD